MTRTQGDLGAAIDFANRALERDPLNVRKLDDYGHILWASHNYEMSEKALRKAIHLHPGTPGVNADLVYSLLGQRKYEEALHHAMQEENVLGRARVLPIIYARLGRRDEADEALANVIAEHGNVLAFQIAEIYADDGMIDEAFEWLNISIETRDGGITHLPYDPLLESLHDDPRWLETLERVDLADAWRRAESYIRQRDESAAASL